MKTLKNFVKESFKINKNTELEKVSASDLNDWIEYFADEFLSIFDTSGDDWMVDPTTHEVGSFEEALTSCSSLSDLLDFCGAFDEGNQFINWEEFYADLFDENDLGKLGIKNHDDLIDFFYKHDDEITKYILSQL